MLRYAASASGPKDLVVVIDVSGSMNDNRRINHAKVAAAFLRLSVPCGEPPYVY
jgi:Mg-chelatase subunit ChlD